ncbi:MAG: bifunctional riboflavin kinase/FAD synthetase [Azoarcus sp.]|jgi:riboflavin kinase/FMN adenylyltransferase|nr:bifunctional riboflavin kinase/FAD synthetase [Azoarcus sp.]
MQVFRGIPAQASQACVLTIGNFDGLHLGHQALLRLLADKAMALGLPTAVLTFEPHPRELFSPEDAPARLTSLREKLLLLGASGVDRVYIGHFTRRFATLDAQTFVDALVRGLAPRHLLIGDDFCFGARRGGDFALLQTAGQEHGFTVEAMPTLTVGGERASSSAVRQALASGALDHAARLLGRPYSIAGRVVHGDQIGRKLGFPTANLHFRHRRPALRGVFAVAVEGIGPARRPAIANVGLRPTASQGVEPRLEIHVLDWAGHCYGKVLRVHFLHKLRAEVRFPSLDALKTQIAHDEIAARDWFSLHPDSLRG